MSTSLLLFAELRRGGFLFSQICTSLLFSLVVVFCARNFVSHNRVMPFLKLSSSCVVFPSTTSSQSHQQRLVICMITRKTFTFLNLGEYLKVHFQCTHWLYRSYLCINVVCFCLPPQGCSTYKVSFLKALIYLYTPESPCVREWSGQVR